MTLCIDKEPLVDDHSTFLQIQLHHSTLDFDYPSLLGKSEAPCPQGGASRKGNLIYIVPLDPAYKAGLVGHLPAKWEKTSAKRMLRGIPVLTETLPMIYPL
jgi:hypothetical protein